MKRTLRALAVAVGLLAFASTTAHADLPTEWLAQESVVFYGGNNLFYIIAVQPNAGPKPADKSYEELANEAVCHVQAVSQGQALTYPVLVVFWDAREVNGQLTPIGDGPVAEVVIATCQVSVGKPTDVDTREL